VADQRVRRRLPPHLGFFLSGQFSSGIFGFHLTAQSCELRFCGTCGTGAEDLGSLHRDRMKTVRSFVEVKVAGYE